MLSISSVVDFQGCALNQTCFTGGYPVNHSSSGGCVFTYAIKNQLIIFYAKIIVFMQFMVVWYICLILYDFFWDIIV